MRSSDEKLRDILEAISSIEKYTSDGRSRFDADELVRTWVIHHLQSVGGAAGRLGEEFCSKHPEFPWAQMIAMRNILVHEYFGIDPDQVWTVVEKDLPRLKVSIQEILDR